MTDDETRQMNLERLRNYSHALYAVIIERYKILPLISTLSAAVVGLIIQSATLVKTADLAFIALFMLIALIPISVFGILYQSGHDIEALATKIKNLPDGTNRERDASDFMGICYVIFLIAIILLLLSFF